MITLVSSNETHFSFESTCRVRRPISERVILRANSLVGHISLERLFTPTLLAERIFLFSPATNSPHFFIDRLNGQIRLLKPLSFAGLTSQDVSADFNFTCSLNEIELFRVVTVYQISVRVRILIDPAEPQSLEPLVPTLVRRNYDLSVDKRTLNATKSDVELIGGLEWTYPGGMAQQRAVAVLFNVSYSIDRPLGYELPFYVDTKSGQVFFFKSQLGTRDAYRFRVLAVFWVGGAEEGFVAMRHVDVRVEFVNNEPVASQQRVIERDDINGKELFNFLKNIYLVLFLFLFCAQHKISLNTIVRDYGLTMKIKIHNKFDLIRYD